MNEYDLPTRGEAQAQQKLMHESAEWMFNDVHSSHSLCTRLMMAIAEGRLVEVVGPVYRPTGVPQARPQELEDLIQDGWLVEVGEERPICQCKPQLVAELGHLDSCHLSTYKKVGEEQT